MLINLLIELTFSTDTKLGLSNQISIYDIKLITKLRPCESVKFTQSTHNEFNTDTSIHIRSQYILDSYFA